MNILLNIGAAIYCKAFSFLALVGGTLFNSFGIVYTFSLEDAVHITKHIGVFKKKRKVRTNFSRH